jgi:ribosomal-protein-alanine N-acetyltransferase
MLPTLHFPDRIPELTAGSLLLRAPTEDDIPSWYERARDVESAFLAGDPVPESIAAGFEWLARNRERFRQRTGIRWVIVPEGSPRSVGSIGLGITSSEDRVAEFGFVIARAHWGRGIATAAGRLVTRFGFDVLQLAEIRAEALESNIASRRVLEKLGFQFEHVIPDFDRTEAGPVDGCLYALRCAARPPARHYEP